MRIKLSQEMKAHLMSWKKATGLSYRSIGAACSVSPSTVMNWLLADGVKKIDIKHIQSMHSLGEQVEKYNGFRMSK